MAINPPEGIADFLAFVSGMEWPEADEDLMRRVSEHYGAVARDLETLSGYVIELIPIVKNDFDGEAAASFLLAMNDLTGRTAGANQLEQTAELSRQLSEVALKVANQVEYTKIMAILQLVQLLAEILFATLFSVFTFGSVWGPVSALFAATREGLHQLFRWLLQTIISQTFIGIVGGVFQDTVIQLYQLGAGHTTSWNTESLVDSIKQGALSGVVAGPLEILSHYGGKLLGRLLGGKTPGSIISKRVDDVLNKVDDKLDGITPNPKPDVPAGGAGAKAKLDDLASKSDKDLPPVPHDKAPNGVTPPPVPPKTVGDGLASPPATGARKPEAPAGATVKDTPTAPTTGTKGNPAAGPGSTATTGKGDVPPVHKTGAPTAGKGDMPTVHKDAVPTTGKGDAPAGGRTDAPAPEKADVPAAQKTETVGGNEAPGRTAAGDTPGTAAPAKAPDASAAGRTAGDAGTPLDELLATPEARSAFAKDVGELLGGVSRNLETGFLRFGEGTIADSFSKKMGDVFTEHLGRAGAREAGEAFGEMLTRKWVRLGADHTELPELLTKALGDFGRLAPLRNLADSMPNLFARSEHSNALARIFKQENPLQGSPMYQLGGAVASLLNEGTNEMLSEGFYNLIFGDGTFKVSGGPFASGVAMGALSAGLHRAFEPITVRYQNWVLSHQHAENPHDSKYFGLLHPINIASFVANMTGNPAPWPVPRPTSEVQDPSFVRDMKDMVKWVFSHPITGTPFFADLPQRPDVTVESDGDGAFTPLDLDLGPSFGDEIATDPLFRTAPDGGVSTGDGAKQEDAEGSATVPEPARTTVSSDLSSLLGDGTESRVPDPTAPNPNPAAARPVTQSGGDRFTAPVPQESDSAPRAEAPAQTETPGRRPHPLQAEKDRAAAEGLDYLLPYDSADDDPTLPHDPAGPVPDDPAGPGGDDAADGRSGLDADRGESGGDGTTAPSEAPVRDIPSGIAVGVLTPAQTTALQAFPRRPGVFVIGMHTDPRTPHDPDAVLKALTDAHDEGRLNDITEIRFTACSLAAPVHEHTVRTVMSGLWKHRAAKGTTAPDPLTARAADAPVWYVPTTGGDTAAGHLLTARHIGLTPDGRIAVVDEGAWHVYGDGGDPDHTPVRTTPEADALPDDAVRFLFRTPAVDAEHPDAVKFGPGGSNPSGNGEGSSTRPRPGSRTHTDSGTPPDQAPPGEGPPGWARDASIEDQVRIRYLQASETYERRLAAHLSQLTEVRELARVLSQTLWSKLKDRPRVHEELGTKSIEMPGAVGADREALKRVVNEGNLRERMTLFFNSISSLALPQRIQQNPSYPGSLTQERPQRHANPDLDTYRTAEKRIPELRRTGADPRELQRLNDQWQALDSVLRPFREADAVPSLSATERRLALNSSGKLRWIPGGSRFTLDMSSALQRESEARGRLVTAGTSGSGYSFHRYAQLMADRWGIAVDHRTLRLAVIATFVGQGHHSLPEVLAGSSAFAETLGHLYPGRDDIASLRMPAPGDAPGRDHYRLLGLLPEEDLRAHVAERGLFPDEIAEEYRQQLFREFAAREAAADPDAMDVDVEEPGTPADAGTGTKRSREGEDDRNRKYRRDDGSPAVPEDSPHSLPGRLRPEEVAPAVRPIAVERWAAWSWTPGRQDVPPPARVRTERFDPAADPDVTGPFPGTSDRRNDDGTLAGRRTLISADVQRFTVPPDGDGTPGGAVRLVQVTLPVAVDDHSSAADVAALRDRLQKLLDTHVNLGFRLPRSGDQLHMDVRLDPRPVPKDGVKGDDWVTVSRDAGPGVRSDQLHFRLHADDADPDVRDRDDAMLLHELLHYAGLPDRYHDAETLFRHRPGQADASGVMATALLPDGTLPLRYLAAVEDVTESGSVLHDNDGPGAWTAPLTMPVRDIPAGIAVGALSAARSSALSALPPRRGVFVVGMHTDPRTPHDPDAVLKALTDAHDEGRLDGVTEIRFTGCDLATPVHEHTVRTVMSGLWKHRAAKGTETGPLTALAADAPVWYVPGGDGLFTARHVGVTADGRVTVFGDGADWHRYDDTGAPDHTAASSPVGDDGAPADAVRTARPDDPAHGDAVRFGEEDGESESSSFSMTSAGLVPRQWTVDFGKGEKTLTEAGRTVVRSLARELFPELVRRAYGPSRDPLEIRVAAGGNNRLPGAAEGVGADRAHAVAGALATEIRKLATERNLPEVEPLAVFTVTTRGRDLAGSDRTGDASPSVLRRRGTVLAELQPLPRVLERSATMNLAELAVFRQLADLTDSRRMTFSLDELVGSRVYQSSGATPLEEHNVVFRLETEGADRSTRRDWAAGLVTFTPDTRVEVVSFERTDSGRSLVTLREVRPDDREDRPLEEPARATPAIGLPGVGYAGPSRPFDSTLVHHKDEGRYGFRKALYIHRGEVEVEMTERGPHVRFYTAVTNQTPLTIDRESGSVTAEYKDIQQDPETGEVVLSTGPNMGGTLWTGIGTPARAVAWAMKYKAENPDANRPLIRSYLVPLHVYREITSTAVPEGDVNALGDPYRGSESLVPQGLREPLAVPTTPEGVAYRKRAEAQGKGSAPDPIEGPTPLADRSINTDQPGERNQFGIRGSHLTLLRESILPKSLITYYERSDLQDLTQEEEGSAFPRNGRTLHVDELRDRLGIPRVDAPQLKSDYNPWVQNRKHVNSADKLRNISHQLRQFYATWQQSRQQPADRRPSLLLDPDATVLTYEKRLGFLERFLKEHNRYLRDEHGAELSFAFLHVPDRDTVAPADLAARETVEKFMVDTVLTWASHAEIGYLLSRQHQEVKGDRNVTDAPLIHDFDEMRRHRKEDVHLQLQVGTDLTELWRQGEPAHRLINRLIRDYPELSLLYGEICAPSERYTFFQHAQMVLGQYLKLAHRDRDDTRRVVPVDAIVKAILFHDIEKANSKVMYGDDKDPDQEPDPEEKKPKKAPKRKEQHDDEAEHRGAVDLMSRYRHLWGDVDGDEDLARAYRAAVMMVDSDPFGFYYRKKHHTKDAANRDATFHWIVEAYLRLRGRPLITSDGTTRRLATLDDADAEGIRRLFHEFHQYYQADFSSYTRYGRYSDYEAPERTRRGETLSEENPGAFEAAPREPAGEAVGKETFTQQFVSDAGQEPLDPENRYGTGPRMAETSPVGERHGLRFVFDTKYETMYAEIAKMFATDEDVRANFRRVGGERMRSDAKALGDEANAKAETPPPDAPGGDGGTAPTDRNANEDAPVDPLDDGDDYVLGIMALGNGEAPAPTTPRSSAERIDQLVVSLTGSHEGNGTHHLLDPDTDPAEADRIRGAVGRFPRDDRFFTLAGHIAGTDGAPTWRGQRVSAGELAVVLSRLADDGVWDTARPLRFAACGLGENTERSYVADTLRALRELRPDLPLTAYAPRSTLWFVPSVTGPFTTDTTGPGHTAVARKVVWGSDGTPRLVPDHWVELTLPVGRDATVRTTLLDGHMPPDGRLSPDGRPATTPAPDGYRADGDDTSEDLSEAVPFGPADDGGDEHGTPRDDRHRDPGRPPAAVVLPSVDWSF
ncbi:hypothetical protein ACGF1Z_11850 [Streptomyces sp. NPDC048018]|uniref:WXG100-like domain-containing protein n=1 Tax=Streptomyces sp. NPDC048018 TaxID=3365499 RepID=UPI0037168696